MTQINSENASVALLEPEKSTQIQYTDFEGLLQIYYERLFPFKKFHRWLTLGSQFPFENREFSFTLADDVYLRFQSFQDEKDIEAKVAKLCPYKIDIGAVYNARPSDRKNINPNAFKSMEKELVFDIDMTDYDDVRKCCKDKKICAKCWKFVAIAAKILDTALAEDFGFQHRLWVFSGRRGIHCWVSDVNAKKLAQNARKAIIGYLEIIRGGDELRKKVHFSTCLHPFVERSKELLEDYFEDIVLVEQNFLLESQECEKVLYMIPDENLRQRIRQKWADTDNLGSSDAEICIKKWEILKSQVNSYEPGKKTKFSLKNTVTEIIFQLLFPRLDSNVSVQFNHLLKSPFCVHPDTWKICVPISIESVFLFDPNNVPTLPSLIKEIDQFPVKGANDVLKTSLKPFFDIFSKFVAKMETAQAKSLLHNSNEMEF